jgi:hypothetical protein
LFADIYSLAAAGLPTFDLVTLFHLCEFGDPSSAVAALMTTACCARSVLVWRLRVDSCSTRDPLATRGPSRWSPPAVAEGHARLCRTVQEPGRTTVAPTRRLSSRADAMQVALVVSLISFVALRRLGADAALPPLDLGAGTAHRSFDMERYGGGISS